MPEGDVNVFAPGSVRKSCWFPRPSRSLQYERLRETPRFQEAATRQWQWKVPFPKFHNVESQILWRHGPFSPIIILLLHEENTTDLSKILHTSKSYCNDKSPGLLATYAVSSLLSQRLTGRRAVGEEDAHTKRFAMSRVLSSSEKKSKTNLAPPQSAAGSNGGDAARVGGCGAIHDGRRETRWWRGTATSWLSELLRNRVRQLRARSHHRYHYYHQEDERWTRTMPTRSVRREATPPQHRIPHLRQVPTVVRTRNHSLAPSCPCCGRLEDRIMRVIWWIWCWF